MTHLENLQLLVSTLGTEPILDIGSGEGAFVNDAKSRGFDVVGLEYYPEHIRIALEKGAEMGIRAEFIEGRSEELPFSGLAFGFINMSEVIEHVENPHRTLMEAFRVLRHGGSMYLSVPARFSMRDPHYHLWFINWMPRTWADFIVRRCGYEKDGQDLNKGYQRLSEMHYYTYNNAFKLVRSVGFSVSDIREMHIRTRLPLVLRPFALFVYRLLRPFYFDTFHLLLLKP